MELWIRSQDRKRLIKIEEVYMVEDDYKKDNILSFPKYYIGNTLVGHLGIYKTKERALEVLNEMQKIINQNLMFHIDKSQCNTIEDIANPKFIIRDVNIPRVYEMPED